MDLLQQKKADNSIAESYSESYTRLNRASPRDIRKIKQKAKRKFVKVGDFIKAFLDEYEEQFEGQLIEIKSEQGLENNFIEEPDVGSPGLGLIGFFEYFPQNRLQVFGKSESAYLIHIENEGNFDVIKRFLQNEVPACVFTHNCFIPLFFIEMARQYNVPIIRTSLTFSDFVLRASSILETMFAPRITRHGVLVEVFGLGVLIIGGSGIGKSECALELIERGHRLIADDLVEIRCIHGNTLIGRSVQILEHRMELRGIGIIDIASMFGVGAIRQEKRIDMVIELEEWDEEKEYDRLGFSENYIELLGVKLPHLLIPVRPGRNIPVVIETAARNQRLKKMGYNAARAFAELQKTWLASKSGNNGEGDL